MLLTSLQSHSHSGIGLSLSSISHFCNINEVAFGLADCEIFRKCVFSALDFKCFSIFLMDKIRSTPIYIMFSPMSQYLGDWQFHNGDGTSIRHTHIIGMAAISTGMTKKMSLNGNQGSMLVIWKFHQRKYNWGFSLCAYERDSLACVW